MKLPIKSEPFTEKGGNPSVREFLSLVDFNPLKGIIEFNGARIVMQRANVGHLMRRELRALLGEENTRIFLMRQGFQSGRADALFVLDNWPHLDIGDAFTAGTRLHTFTGTVRVETVHNDFDLKTKRFSGEFIWHDSVEAEQIAKDGLRSLEPCCWTLVGYASGYATAFFGKPIFYKETSCIAQGKKTCHVVGKPLDDWNQDDPDAVRFRDHVLPRDPVLPMAPAATGLPRRSDDPIAAIVGDALSRRMAAGVPCTLSGPEDSGRRRALEAALPAGKTRHLWHDGAELTSEILRSAKPTTARPVLIDRPELCSHAVQNHLARDRIPFHCTTTLTPAQLRGDRRVHPILQAAIAPGLVAMPAFDERPEANRKEVVAYLADEVSGRLPKPIGPETIRALTASRRLTGPAQITAILLCLGTAGGDVDDVLAGFEQPAPDADTDPRLSEWLDDTLAQGTLDLSALERRIRRAALRRENGNLAAAARRLHLTRAQLAYRLRSDDDMT